MSVSATNPFATLDPARQKLAYARAVETLREEGSKAYDAQRAIQVELARRATQKALRATPPVFEPLNHPARYKGSYGGRGSAKSWTFGKKLLQRCVDNPGTRAVCIREVQKSLEQSVKRLLEDLIELYDLGKLFRVLTTHIETPGGGIIIFQGMQNHTADSIKSLEGYDVAWVEEAQSLSDRSLTLLRPTLRKPGSELWFTWNPRKKTDPIDQLLRGKTTPPDAVVIEASWKDNPHLPEVLRKEMEWDRSRDIDKYNHVWGGQYEQKSEARVFRNYVVEEFSTPSDAVFLFGGDWGFATDPDVLLRMYIVGMDLFIDHEVYMIGCEIDDTPALFDSLACTQNHLHDIQIERSHRAHTCDSMARQWQILTDSARPETISYMQRHGYPRVLGAKKGPGSIEEGIKFLKTYNIHIHPRCTHTVDEFGSYSYKTDPNSVDPITGGPVIIPVLEDKKNHVIDSARYGVENIRNPMADFVVF